MAAPRVERFGIGDVERDVTRSFGAVRGHIATLASGRAGIEDEEEVATDAEEDVTAGLPADDLEAQASPESLGAGKVVDVEGGFVDAADGRMNLGHSAQVRFGVPGDRRYGVP